MTTTVKPPSSWADLRVRVGSGVVLAAVGLGAVWVGGSVFVVLVTLAAAVMVWEVRTMVSPNQPTEAMLLAGLAAAVLAGLMARTSPWEYLLLGLPGIVGALRLPRERAWFLVYTVAICAGALGLIHFRIDYDRSVLIWMVLVVVMTDVAGYFAGRSIGGRKFWPAISPKKTWSGTVAGWIGAVAVAGGFVWLDGWNWLIVPLSVALSFASQMGDIAESALKRHLGAKDSSALIPGHGGVYDRFDGMIGAALALVVLEALARLAAYGP